MTFLLVLLVAVCRLGADAASLNYQKLVKQGKGFTAHPSFDWLQDLSLPLPKYTYDSTAVEKIDEYLLWRSYFAEEVGSWLDFFEESNLTHLNWSDPSTFICSTTDDLWDSNYTDHNRGSCPNGSFVSTPWYVVNWLTWNMPYELCDKKQDHACSSYVNSSLSTVNATGDLVGELKKQKQVADTNNTVSRYERIAKVLGVGYPVEKTCRDNINLALGDMDDFTQAGTQAATTIAALIPALLTVGNLFVPRSSEVFVTSFLVGIMSAMFSLGLPVSSISGIKDDQRFNVASWMFKARRDIMKFGKIERRATDGTKNKPSNPVSLQELQKWSKEHFEGDDLTEEQASTDLTFSDLKKQVLRWEKRAHAGGLPALLVACVQMVLFLMTIGPLYFSQGTPMLLFDCNGYWTSTWMFVAAGISAIFRLFMWERGAHERVKLYAMSPTALERFRWFADQSQGSHRTTSVAYVEDSMPPLYPPIIAVIESAVWRTIHAILPDHRPTHMPSRRKSAVQANIATRQKNTVGRRWKVFLHGLRNPKQLFKQSFSLSKPPAAARRWRPLYLLMHLSTSGRNPIWTLLTGLVEGFILIVLTVFFAAQWGTCLPLTSDDHTGHRLSL